MKDLTEAKVSNLPQCNFCPEIALYDFKTSMGPWAYGCEGCWKDQRFYIELGTGKGQRLILTTD